MASPLEEFVNDVRTMSASGDFKELCEIISKSDELLQRNSAHLNTVLETLDLQQHSLGAMAVLVAKYSLPQPNGEEDVTNMFDKIREFITNCNGEQIRFAPDIYANLCHIMTEHLVSTSQPMKGITILKKAISKMQLFDSQLTSIHADLCQLCLMSKCMKPALELLDIDVTSISSELGGNNDSKHFLLYYYYGGMIYAAVKNYDRALYFFEVVVTVPAMVVSHIMLEAYKKYILVSLILHDKIIPLPKYTSQVVNRFVKPLCGPYHELAVSQRAATKHRDVFIKDKNLGLVNQDASRERQERNKTGGGPPPPPVEESTQWLRTVMPISLDGYEAVYDDDTIQQVLSSTYKKNIQKLTKTFLTLSLSDVASRVHLSGPAEAETYILNMIDDGEIFAKINQKDGMVVFMDSPEKYASQEALSNLERQMAECTRLHQCIQDMDEQIQVNPQYMKKSAGNNEEEMPATSQNTKLTYSM